MQQLDLIDLGIKPIIKHTFDNYIVANHNQQVVAHLKFILNQTVNLGSNYLYLWGQPGVGKTHLLQAVCEEAASKYNLAASYFSFKYLDNNLTNLDLSSVLDNLEMQDVICLDDLNVIADHHEWEEQVFSFYNRIKDANKNLIIASTCSVNSISVNLKDLKSRLASGVSYHIKNLDDQDKKDLLTIRAFERGITLTNEIAEYLITHGQRDIVGLFDMLDKLDRASMRQKRKLTIPFVKEVLFD